ncbi:MAG: DoxX family protein [Rhodothermales bacterium]|nr:DoxX family protein [Rhodothermales bacterium]
MSLSMILQLVVGLGLLNVWLLRAKSSTAYRGGSAASLKEEFDAYGLPDVAFYVVGGLKIVAGIALIAGVWMPSLVTPAAAVVAILMVGAIAMHVKVQDPPMKSLPAFLMLVMSAALVYLNS